MEMFEKVDALRERANVGYEEAKSALERSNGDILEAMIILEREGKTRNTKGKSFNSGCASDSQCIGNKARNFGQKIKSLLHKSVVNYLVIDHKGERFLKLPVLVMILLLIFAFPVTAIAVVVSLFLDCRYSFEGQNEMKTANDVCTKACNIADQVKDKVVTEYNAL